MLEESRIDEAYAVTFSEDFDQLDELRPIDPGSGIVLVGTWEGIAGKAKSGCAFFRGDAYLFQNRVIEIQSVKNLRVLE